MADPNTTPNTFGDELYAALTPLAYDDANHDYALKTYCYALAQMFGQVEQLARGGDDGIPWSGLKVDIAPGYALPYLAQLVGQDIPVGTGDAAARAIITDQPYQDRGTVAALKAAAASTLTGDKTVWVIERDGGAYKLSMFTKTSETPDPTATEAAIRSMLPAGIVLTYQTITGNVWDLTSGTFDAAGTITWDQAATAAL